MKESRLAWRLVAALVVVGYVACGIQSPAHDMARPGVLAAAKKDLPSIPLADHVSRSAPDTIAPPPNVILIVADALRSDHVSAYGYGRQTTPNLDALVAQQGVRFQDATTTAPWTCPANAAIMTGRSPSSLVATWNTISNTLPADANTLAEYLRKAGYYTAGFANTYCVKGRLGFAQGFDHYDDSLSDRPTSNKARAGEVNLLVTDWLQNAWTPELSSTHPLFLFIYYFDPHGWYDPPSPFDTLYDAAYTGTLTAEVYKDGEDVVSGKITPTARDVEHLLALYDGEISYWDAQLGQMLAYLQGRHILDNAVIVVTADHGEMFGEHDQWVHGCSLYDEVLRVPLVMRYTGVISSGMVVTTPVQNMDVMPTLLDWAGLAVPTGLQGVSLRPLAQAGTVETMRDIFSELDAVTDPASSFYWVAPRVNMRSVQQAEWKLIHHVGGGADELYRLQSASLYERQNLLTAEPDRALQLRHDLMDWFGIFYTYLPGMAYYGP